MLVLIGAIATQQHQPVNAMLQILIKHAIDAVGVRHHAADVWHRSQAMLLAQFQYGAACAIQRGAASAKSDRDILRLQAGELLQALFQGRLLRIITRWENLQ
ncbi:MAG: hypothetical protein Tsb0027_22240 [Wenzhouxiangellaceae bacterium]